MPKNIKQASQILCDNCKNYAKGTLEGRNLCAGCLLGALMSSKEAELFERLTPLHPKRPSIVPVV